MSLPTLYDDFFREYSDGIPLPFLRALTKKESGFNPVINSKGLMQITPTGRKDYNQRSGEKSVTATQLLDPETNIRIGTWLLRTYANHLDSLGIPMLREDWSNRNFLEALVAGWNSGVYGYAKAAQRVAKRGGTPNHSNTMAEWRKTEPFLASKAKEKWQKEVVSLYLSQLGGGNGNGNGGNGNGGDTFDFSDAFDPANWGIDDTNCDNSSREGLGGGGAGWAIGLGLLGLGAVAFLVTR